MEVVYKNNRVKNQVAKKARSNPIVRKRLKQLKHAPSYLDIPNSAGKHFLKGDLKKFFAIDFDYPARLICEPAGDYKVKNKQFVKETITALEITKIEKDYH